MSAAMVAWPLMKIGLVGLPKSGKTSLFNLLTGATVATSSFGTARGEMHAGVARVPDARVDRLVTLFKPKKTTLATFEVVDLAGIAKGERQGLEAKEFRNADALLHVVRAFPDAGGAAPDPADGALRRRDARDPRFHLPLAEADPALPEPGREGDRARQDRRGELRARRGRGASGDPGGLGLRGDRVRGRPARRVGAGRIPRRSGPDRAGHPARSRGLLHPAGPHLILHGGRSEERRVGKECRSRW